MRQQLKNNLIYYTLKILTLISVLLPHKIAVKIGAYLGKCFYILVPKERAKALHNLRIAFARSLGTRI